MKNESKIIYSIYFLFKYFFYFFPPALFRLYYFRSMFSFPWKNLWTNTNHGYNILPKNELEADELGLELGLGRPSKASYFWKSGDDDQDMDVV